MRAELRGARGAAHRARAQPAIDRVGHLGPDPRGLAFWGAPSYGALDAIARELDGVESPIRLVDAALYNDFGAETL